MINKNKIVLFSVSILYLCVLFVGAESSNGPQWWRDRNVIKSGSVTTNDYAPVNLGQLKNISKQAYDECIERGLPQNASHGLLVEVMNPWLNEDPPVNHKVANVGQVKNIASLFHTWLKSAGYEGEISFTSKGNEYAVANVGQVKNVFNFDPSKTVYNDCGIIGGLLDPSESIRVDGDYETDIAYWKFFGPIPEQTYFGNEGDVVLEYIMPNLINPTVIYPQRSWWRADRNARSPCEFYFLSSTNNSAGGWKSTGLKFRFVADWHRDESRDIPENDSLEVGDLSYYYATGTHDTKVQIVYTGGGTIKLDRPVYMLQWAPRLIIKVKAK